MVGPPGGGGVNSRPVWVVSGGSKRGSVNFVLKFFLRKNGVFKEKNTVFERFFRFNTSKFTFFIDFY